jgi:hypothetical protein
VGVFGLSPVTARHGSWSKRQGWFLPR